MYEKGPNVSECAIKTVLASEVGFVVRGTEVIGVMLIK